MYAIRSYYVLMRIGSGYAATASDLSRALDTDSGSMTRMLDRLEAQGLILRQRSDGDRRVARLYLTESGRITSYNVCYTKLLRGRDPWGEYGGEHQQ